MDIVDAVNQEPFESFDSIAHAIAKDCDWEGVGTTRDEILAAVTQLKKVGGWIAHHTVSIVAHGDFLTATAINDWAHGPSPPVVGIIRFSEDGTIVQLRAMQPETAGQAS